MAITQKWFDGYINFNLRKSSRAVTQIYDTILKPSGLRSRQFALLGPMSNRGSITMTRLAKALVMDRTTLTRNLRPLEKQGFIVINMGDDQRTPKYNAN